MSKKLRNIHAIKQMLDGTHKSQTKKSFSFHTSNADKFEQKKRGVKVGGQIIETIPNLNSGPSYRTHFRTGHSSWIVVAGKWKSYEEYKEYRDGIREDVYGFSNCPKDKCTCIDPTPLDQKMRLRMGMCLECVTAFETQLQIRGEFDDYAKNKMWENVKAYIKEMETQFEQWDRDVREKVTFVNADQLDGQVNESWEPADAEAMVKKMRGELDEMISMLNKMYNPEYTEDEEE